MDYSESLNIIIDKYITENTYGQITPFLKHIFQKRASEFEFSDEEMEEQIKNFCKNCEKITFRPIAKIGSAGYYCHGTKNIVISGLFPDDPNKYSTLTHEVYHAIAGTRNLHYLSSDNHFVGTALNEICNEKATMRTIPRKITPKNYLETTAYQNITPILDLLVAATGVSEKELLKGSFQGRKNFLQVLYSKFPVENYNKEFKDVLTLDMPIEFYYSRFKRETPLEDNHGENENNVAKMLIKFETNLDLIYNASYKKNLLSSLFPHNQKIRKQILSSAIQGLEEAAFELAEYQMSSDEKLTPGEKAYRLKNMENIIKYIKKQNHIKATSTDITQSKKDQIVLMPGVKEALDNPDYEYEEQKFYEEHEIKTHSKDSMFTLKSRFMAMQESILSKLPKPLKSFINRGNQKLLSFPKKLKNKIKLLTNQNTPKLLDSGKDNNDTENKNLFREEIRVKPEDLMPIETKPGNNEEIIYTQPQDTEKNDSEEVR